MSKENDSGEEAQTSQHPSKGGSYLNVSMATLEPDWFLRELVSFVNDFGIEISVTLQVGGVQVTGMMISGEKYFKLTADEFGGAFSNSVLGDKFKCLINGYADSVSSKPDEQERPAPSYIHLSNAHLYSPGGEIPAKQGKPILWRARISAVDGFYIGTSAKALAPTDSGNP